MEQQIYQDISERTGGDIYIGIVGPVRSGKSTLIKRFMDTLILPNIENPAMRARAKDEQPQSAAGRTIMTTEPKFIPESAVKVELANGGNFHCRLVDSVGFYVEGAMGHQENGQPRMVKSPWFEEEIPFDVAAEIGTQKVIAEHSTIGIVVTTDGSISEIPRQNYEQTEERVIAELESINKPYVILLNCTEPTSAASVALATALEAKYHRAVLPVNCVDLDAAQMEYILQRVLYEFPVKELDFAMPRWVTMLEANHALQRDIYGAVMAFAEGVTRMKDVIGHAGILCEAVQSAQVTQMNLAKGTIKLNVALQPEVFYHVLGEQSGLEIYDEASLMPCMIELAQAKREYEKIRSALEQVEATGYGIVMPALDELRLEEPEIVKQGGRYGVRLQASAPSIHLMKATINTEISPIVGSEKQSEDLVRSLLSDFEADPLKIWESNIFGKSLHELVNEGLQNKLHHMPQEARGRLQETLERVINDGCTGLICIIL